MRVEWYARNWIQFSRQSADGDTPNNTVNSMVPCKLFRDWQSRVLQRAIRWLPEVLPLRSTDVRRGSLDVRGPRLSSRRPKKPSPPVAQSRRLVAVSERHPRISAARVKSRPPAMLMDVPRCCCAPRRPSQKRACQ